MTMKRAPNLPYLSFPLGIESYREIAKWPKLDNQYSDVQVCQLVHLAHE